MTFKTILTFHETSKAEDTLEPVIAFAQSIDAHLSVVVLELMPPPPMPVGYGGAAFELWGEEYNLGFSKVKDKLKAVKQWMQKQNIAPNLSFDIDMEYEQAGNLENKIAYRTHYADITVVTGIYGDDDSTFQRILKSTLFDTGRPVLSLKGQNITANNIKRILIAWDAGSQAAKAVWQAVPFLKQAEDVHIAMVDPRTQANGHGEEPGANLASYLVRHDVNVSIHALAGGGRAVSDVLLQHAIDMDAQLIVMGGYGHNRLQEWLFGSTTSRMLKQAECSIFLSH